jgi:biopolymer transport protein ExbB/TolQ
METLSQTLYVVTTALLVPVIAGLLALLAWVLLSLGGFVREAWERRRAGASEATFPWLRGSGGGPSHTDLEAFFDSQGSRAGFLSAFSARGRAVRAQPRELRMLLDELEIDVAARLSHLVLGARVGPMLGLMGTLIPLGPALIGLSEGRIEELAANLVVAFSTTVVGLLAGVLCYAMLHAKRHWYARDLCHLEYICECVDGGTAQ